jgi:uncharacterized membrane protein YjjP (DUF1212 family)
MKIKDAINTQEKKYKLPNLGVAVALSTLVFCLLLGEGLPWFLAAPIGVAIVLIEPLIPDSWLVFLLLIDLIPW